MILALLLTAASGPTALDAERAFAAAAQVKGQWTAFREYAASDATMFVPQPVNAQTWLKDRKDPPKAIEWWPTASYVSCDGSLAVNTGGWKRPDGAVGYFSTVWQRQQDGGWKWIVDGGDDLNAARKRPVKPTIRVAKCERTPFSANVFSVASRDGVVKQGRADDGSLYWYWIVAPDGSRTFGALINGGSKLIDVINDKIAAPK